MPILGPNSTETYKQRMSINPAIGDNSGGQMLGSMPQEQPSVGMSRAGLQRGGVMPTMIPSRRRTPGYTHPGYFSQIPPNGYYNPGMMRLASQPKGPYGFTNPYQSSEGLFGGGLIAGNPQGVNPFITNR